MKKILIFLLPVILLAAIAIYLDRNHPGVFQAWNSEELAEVDSNVAPEDTLELDMDAEQPARVIDSLADFNPGDTTAKLRIRSFPQETAAQEQTKEGELWRIVVASVPNQALADKFLALPAYEGMTARYVEAVNSYRIVAFSHRELPQVQAELSAIQTRFPEAWIARF